MLRQVKTREIGCSADQCSCASCREAVSVTSRLPFKDNKDLHRAATYHDAEVERSLEAGKGEPGTTPDMLTGNLMRRAAPQSVSSISGARSSLVSGAWMGGFNEDIVDARRCAVRASDSWAESALSVIFRTESARAAAAAIKYPVA